MDASRIIAALAVAFALAVLLGCGAGTDKEGSSASTPSSSQSASPDSTITFVLSGDTAGFIVPCGCTTKQFGGLPRRATYLNSLRKSIEPLIYVDAGGSVHRGTEYDKVKFEHIWLGMAMMKAAALNVGTGERRLGVVALNGAAAGAPLVSANSGARCVPTERSVKLPRTGADTEALLAILGVDMAEGDPRAALRLHIPPLTKTRDCIVLLVYGTESDALKLADEFPELAAIFVGGVEQPIVPKTANGVVIAGAGQKGKFLARVTLTGRRNNWKLSSGEIVELSESFADDPAQIENLNAYKRKLKELKLDPKDTGEVPSLLKNLPADYRYAGSEACAKCHVQDAALHLASQHSKGLDTLRNKDFAFDPYCLKCHTTGYGGPGGFVNAEATPMLGGIGCENCHGPGQAHAANPRVKTLVTDSKTACASCHDPENSPKFEFNAYWQKIKHGQEKVK